MLVAAVLTAAGCGDGETRAAGASTCLAAGLSGVALEACISYCDGGCDRSAAGTCGAAREALHAATGRVVFPCDCEREAALRTALLEEQPPPGPEPVTRRVLAVPEGVEPDSVQQATFHPDGDHLIWVASLVGESGLHLFASRIDGSDFACLTCSLESLPFAKPDVFPDGRRILVGNQSPLGTPFPLPFTSPFPDAETVPVLECTPSLLDCRTAQLVFVRIPYDPEDPAMFVNQRVREFRVAPDGVHIGWTQGRSAVPLTLIPVIGELRREADHYEVDDVEVLITRDPAMQPVGDGTFEFHLPTSGEIKRFTQGGAGIALFDPVSAFNGDPALVDVASGAKQRLTHHPDYDEPVDVSPDGRWLVVGSKRSADPAFDVLAALSLLERPPFVDLGGAVLWAGWAFAGNANANRGLDTWLLDRAGARGGYIGQRLSDDVCYGGFERQHWNADGTRVVKREQIRPAMLDAPACHGLPARRVVVYELTSRAPVPPGRHFPIISTPDAPWAARITEVKDAPAAQPGIYVVRGRIFGEARVELSDVGTAIAIEYRSFSDDGLQVLDGREALAIEAQAVPFTANVRASGCRDGLLESDAALDGASITAVFAPLRGRVASRLGDEHFELCAPGQPGLDSCP